MRVIGLTGGSGAGKSYVASLFESFGAAIIDADEVCRGIYEPGGDCLGEVVGAFGRGILAPDGSLDRAALGVIVFSDRAALDRLNAIAHKYIIQKIEERLDCFTNDPNRVIIIDAPQLFEAGMEGRCDAVVAVVAPIDERIARIVQRDGIDADRAHARIAMQHDDEFFRTHATYVIENGVHDDVHAQTVGIYRQIKE